MDLREPVVLPNGTTADALQHWMLPRKVLVRTFAHIRVVAKGSSRMSWDVSENCRSASAERLGGIGCVAWTPVLTPVGFALKADPLTTAAFMFTQDAHVNHEGSQTSGGLRRVMDQMLSSISTLASMINTKK